MHAHLLSEWSNFFFFDLGFTAIKIIWLILSQVNRKVEHKREISQKKKHLTTRKQNLACLTCDKVNFKQI